MPVKPATFFQTTDAILDVDTAPTLRAHATAAPHLFPQYLSAMADSYDGIPDMIRAMVNWYNAMSLPGDDILCDATATVLRNHPTIVTNLNTRLRAHPAPHPLLAAMLRAPRWHSSAIALANAHPDSAFSFHVSRYRALADEGLSDTTHAAPQDLSHTIARLFRDTLASDAPVTNASVAALTRKVAVLATQDDDTALVTLHALHRIASRAPDPVFRTVARAVTHATESRIAQLAPQRSAQLRYALKLSALAVTPLVPPSQLDPVLTLLPAASAGLSASAVGASGVLGARRRTELDTPSLRVVLDLLLGSAAPAAMPDATNEDIEVVEIAPPRTTHTLDATARLRLARQLAHPSVVSTLFAALFSPSDAPRDPGRRMALASLVALASAIDRYSDTHLEAALTAPASLSRDVASANTTLLAAAATCEQMCRPNIPPARLVQALRTLIRTVSAEPLCARGALVWAREILLSTGASLVAVKRALCVLEAAARHHMLLRDPVLQTLRAAFEHEDKTVEPLKRADRREMLVKCLVGLVHAARMGTPIVRALVDTWLDLKPFTTDHVRLLLSTTLGAIAPPYPPRFASALTALLQHARVAQLVARDPDISRLVMEFRSNAYGAGDTKAVVAI